VAEPPRDEEELLPRFDQMGAVRVPEVVEPDPLESGPCDSPVEHLSHALGVQGSAVRLREDEAVPVLPASPHREPVLRLLSLSGSEYGHGAGVEVDGPPAAVGLRPLGKHEAPIGGRLDLGVVRDSILDATNDYETFVEVFEGIAGRGIDAYAVTQILEPTGGSAGTVASTSYHE